MSHQNGKSPSKVMWENSKVETNMSKFMTAVNNKYALKLSTYDDLWKWSTDKYDDFWHEVMIDSEIKLSQKQTEVVDTSANITQIPKWFKGAKLNYAENLLKYNDDCVALISTGEGREPVKITYKELNEQVTVVASALKSYGVVVNDKIAGYIPNCIEAVVVMLACASIGAVWSSTSPDFGVKGVLDRFQQIKPKILFTVNAVTYNGKIHSHWEKAGNVANQLPETKHVVVIPFVQNSHENFDHCLSRINKATSWQYFYETGKENRKSLVFEQLDFDHPMFIMYSSGTTGKPKCMVHSAGGTLIQHAKEHLLHGDMDRKDVFIYYTTTGWMMWNWLIGALFTGCTLVLYDGSPFKPTEMILWDIVDELGVTVLGVSAKCLSVMEEKQQSPATTHKLTTLRTILSTGSPLAAHQYDYVYNHVKDDVQLASITGGTDIISCFAGHNPMVPVVRGEIQSANLGMSIKSYNEDEEQVHDEPGELVCTVPFPSMPVSFYNDSDGHLYKKAYFSGFKGVWSHGDYCVQSSTTNGWTFLGRSDATLNPNGIRIGTSEIYSVIEKNFSQQILDSVAAAHRPSINEEKMVLFVVMRPGVSLDLRLEKELRTRIRSCLSPRHVPWMIKCVSDIPYTISGKKVEVAVTKILSGQKVNHKSAFRNPGALDCYHDIMKN